MREPLPADMPLTLYRGDTRIWEQTFTTSDGEPIDLTGHDIAAQVRTSRDSSDVLTSFDVELTRAAEGVIRLTLTSVQTAALPATAYWDLQLTRTADQFVRTYITGKIRIRGDVTRA